VCTLWNTVNTDDLNDNRLLEEFLLFELLGSCIHWDIKARNTNELF
jgi:hypothetical protein